MSDHKLLEHRLRALEHTVGGNGQPGLAQHVDKLQAIAAQARFVASVGPVVLTIVGAFLTYFVFDEIRGLQGTLRTDARQDSEIAALRAELAEQPPPEEFSVIALQVDELWEAFLGRRSTPAANPSSDARMSP